MNCDICTNKMKLIAKNDKLKRYYCENCSNAQTEFKYKSPVKTNDRYSKTKDNNS